MKTVAVIGEGAWGTAIARVLADNGHHVILWCNDACVADTINQQQVNSRYMPQFNLSTSVQATGALESIFQQTDTIFISTPTAFFRTIVTRCKPYYTNKQVWVVLSKGIENESLKVPTQVLAEILDPAIKTAVLGGPSFAQEVMERKLTGVMLASVDQERAQFITSLLANHYFYPWVSDDELGVQLGGALKNVGALLMGIAQGAGFSDNTRAWLFTRCWHELTFIACSLGAQEKTLAGLAGIGDLFLTVLGSYSRNLALGRSIGQGHGVRYAASDVCVLPEGINTIRSVRQLIDQRGLTLVLCQALYAIIFEKARNELLLQAVVSSENYSN